MFNALVKYFSKRSAGQVSRFHTEEVTGSPQTVAEHSHQMIVLLLHLLGDDCSRNLLIAAAYHDLAEKFTGDVPAPVKWYNPNLRVALHEAEKFVREKMGTVIPELTEWERKALKAADVLECCYTCFDQVMRGNQLANAIFDRLVTFINDNGIFDFEPRFVAAFVDLRAAYRGLRGHDSNFLRSYESAYLWNVNRVLGGSKDYDPIS